MKQHIKKLRKQIFINKNQLINNEVSLNGVDKELRKVMKLNVLELNDF